MVDCKRFSVIFLVLLLNDILYNSVIFLVQLILMKTGGQIIYSGILGHHSSKLIEYFEVCQTASNICCNKQANF